MPLKSNKERSAFWSDLNKQYSYNQIEQALATLKTDLQIVIRMHYQQNIPLVEIPAKIDKSLESVRVYQRSGMFKLYLYFKRFGVKID